MTINLFESYVFRQALVETIDEAEKSVGARSIQPEHLLKPALQEASRLKGVEILLEKTWRSNRSAFTHFVDWIRHVEEEIVSGGGAALDAEEPLSNTRPTIHQWSADRMARFMDDFNLKLSRILYVLKQEENGLVPGFAGSPQDFLNSAGFQAAAYDSSLAPTADLPAFIDLLKAYLSELQRDDLID